MKEEAQHRLAFYASCVRQEIRSGGEAIKALEVLEREVSAALESEPLAEIVAQHGTDAKGRHYLVFDDSVIRPNIYEYAGDPPMSPVTVTITERPDA